ncbi:U-box domain-containing protein 44-like isoform X1 [Salvia miltiorrhiza]|uniref:U-box domain-containing protein 44-like isoform X1 n=1 Tax=Salvia miltiorrhiza TaxID=226208 RepID=UPI0025AC9BDB|nr:U-box domain-containing protein 44-like isoform X1 [Salvia miltiorrhiza]
MEEFDSRSSSSSMKTEAVAELSILIERINPILSEIRSGSMEPALEKAIASLESDYERARAAVASPPKHIECLVQNLGRSLGLTLFASRDSPLSNKEKIEALCKEIMNVRFDSSSWAEETETEIEAEEIVEEIAEEETRVLSVDEAILEIKYGGEEEFKNALLVLDEFVRDGMIRSEVINDQELPRILCSRFRSCKGNHRFIVIRIITYLAQHNAHHKEKMKDLEFLSALVKSLARDAEEQKAAVGLLLSLSDDAGVRRRIGRIRGCIVMLVAISNADDEEASRDARMLLNFMSTNTQHALHMAEAGYFKPLIKYLKQGNVHILTPLISLPLENNKFKLFLKIGSEMSKVLMASAVSRLELTDQNKASLGEEGAIEPLVSMFKAGNLEAKLSALNALESVSNLKSNIQRLIDSGMVAALLQLLFSVTSVLMSLREPASAILAKVARSETILVKHDVAQQMLSLLNLSSPIIQTHLLDALNHIASHPTAARVRRKMRDNGAVHLLLPFVAERDPRIRRGALQLLHALSRDAQLTEELDHSHLHTIATVLLSATPSDCDEKAAALGILANLPINDKKITDILKHANILPYLASTMSFSTSTMLLDESIAGFLLRFTNPSDKRLQHYAAEHGVFPLLIKLLASSSEAARSKAALGLSQLSQNTLILSKSRKLKWLCMPPSVDSLCQVHDHHCTVKGNLCLVKAGAVAPLVQILEGGERGADEAVLGCLSTLLQDEIWERGCGYLVRKAGVHSIIKVAASGSFKAQEKALWILERVFRVESHREEYGESAQVVLIELAQNGDAMLAPAVAKVLAQLELLQTQSTYFT